MKNPLVSQAYLGVCSWAGGRTLWSYTGVTRPQASEERYDIEVTEVIEG